MSALAVIGEREPRNTGLGLGLFKFAWDKWRVPRLWGQYIWLVCLGILGLVLNLYVG
jgi:hypothetical protein